MSGPAKRTSSVAADAPDAGTHDTQGLRDAIQATEALVYLLGNDLFRQLRGQKHDGFLPVDDERTISGVDQLIRLTLGNLKREEESL